MDSEERINESFMPGVPPSSIDAERSVIGAMLQETRAAGLAIENLQPEDFYSPEHREIFEAMKVLHSAGTSIDFISVKNQLANRGTLDSVGGDSYLLEALRYVPSTANVRTYISIVAEKSILRRLIAASQEIQRISYNQSDPLEEVLQKSEKMIFDIVMRRTGADTLSPIMEVLCDTVDHIEEQAQLQGKLSGVPTGIYDLDRALTCLHGGELVLVGARPAMGKTAMALGVAEFAAIKAGCSVAIFSMEMPKEQIGLRMLCSVSNLNMQRVRTGMLTDEEWVKIGEAVNKLSNCQIYIDDTAGLTPSQLRSRCRRLMMEKGLDLIVVDYLGLMTTDKESENRQQEVSKISRQLKAIALELKIPVLACAQLSRLNTTRQNKRPMLSDLRDSGSIEQDADVVLFLHREGYYNNSGDDNSSGPKPDDNEGVIIIAKQRNGPIGDINVDWQAEFVRYANKPNTKVAIYADRRENAQE